ncbi:MAG: hypothetical protein E4H44_06010 [Candidatus Aminicenantes bacterium]|nr:MAG: hypothetical protein E4H44_06010 [Candidatus Aminicenantes bacterium]
MNWSTAGWVVAVVLTVGCVYLGRELRRARGRVLLLELAVRCTDELDVTINPTEGGRYYWRVSPMHWSSAAFTTTGYCDTEVDAERQAEEAAVVLQAAIFAFRSGVHR